MPQELRCFDTFFNPSDHEVEELCRSARDQLGNWGSRSYG